jgi:hypothetical protein
MEQGIRKKNKIICSLKKKTKCFIYSVEILGLDADTNYNIEVYAEQISTHLLSKSVGLSFTTKRPSTKIEIFGFFLIFFFFLVPKLIRDINSTNIIKYNINKLVIK